MKIFIKPLCCLVVLVSFFSSDLRAQFDLKEPIPVDPHVKIGRLPNGLTYYIQKNLKPEKKMELRLVVNAGSILEDPDQRGLAHFMEHMNFNGSKHFPKNELVDYLQKVGVKFGADLNASTGFDETIYILPISSDNPEIVEKGFTVLEDWAGNNLLDKNEIEKERGVVLEESRLSKGAQERMLRQYFPKLFNGSRYAERLPIGTDTIIKSFNPATLSRFYKQWYRPDLMAVVVVGDIDPAEAEKKIIAHFSGFKNPANEKPRPAITPIAPRTKPEAMVITDDETTNSLLEVFNYITPSKKIKTWGDYRESIKRELINALINERLNELTQKENPPFVGAFTGTDQFIRGYDAFISAALLGNNTTKEAIDALLAETERARKFGFLPAELQRAKANLLNEADQAAKEKDKTQSSSLVSTYVDNFLEANPIPGAENRFDFLKQILPGISLTEINEVAKKMPPPANAFALVTAPTKTKDKLPSNEDLQKQIVAAASQPVKPYEEKAIASDLVDASIVAGKTLSEKNNAKLGTTDLTLSNGVTITMKPTNFKNDEILMDAWRWGGWQKFPLEDKDNAKHAAEIVGVMGVKDLSPTDLEKFLSGKTVEVSPYINDHEEGIGGSSSVKDFETFLQLINLYFTQPRKDESLFNSYISKQKGQLQFAAANPRYFFQDTLTKIAYNSNPWISGVPTLAEYSDLNLEKIMADYKKIFNNADGMHFTFVGNIDTTVAKTLFEKYLGSLPGKPEEHRFKDNGARPVQGPVLANIKKGKEPQSFINIMWSGETTYSREETLALKALIEALNIQIIEKLREEMSGIYGGGMSGAVLKRPYVHYDVVASIPCGPENVDKLTAALFDLIRHAQDEGIEQKDLDKVKETWKKQYSVSLQNNEAWLDNLSQAYIDQNDPQNILDYEQKVDALTVKDLQNAAKKFLSTTNYVKTVLYPENAKVEEGVKKAF